MGLTITLVGMLVVFFFLALIVVVMNLMSGIILKFFPEKEEPQTAAKGKSDNLAEIALAVAAAQAAAKS